MSFIRIFASILTGIAFTFVGCNNPVKNNLNDGSNNKAENNDDSLNVQPVEMISFSGGTFMMGSNDGLPQEKPVHQVSVASFRIDKYPVTVKEFKRFVDATGYLTDADKFGNSGVFDFQNSGWELKQGVNWKYPLGRSLPAAQENHPVTHISWNDAVAYAKWAGKRLPTEAEWEYAAKCSGKSKSRFSWGNDLIVNGKYKANVWQGNDFTTEQGADGFKLTSPVGFYGETSCGMTDMGGNVWNWCSDTFAPYPGNPMPFELNHDLKVIRGGSFFFDQNGDNSFTSTFRGSNTRETSLFNLGFRCAADE